MPDLTQLHTTSVQRSDQSATHTQTTLFAYTDKALKSQHH